MPASKNHFMRRAVCSRDSPTASVSWRVFFGPSASNLIILSCVSSSRTSPVETCDARDSGRDSGCCTNGAGGVTPVTVSRADGDSGAGVGVVGVLAGSWTGAAAKTLDWRTSSLAMTSSMRSSCLFILCSSAYQRSRPRSVEASILCDTCLYLTSRPKAKATKKVVDAKRTAVTRSSNRANRAASHRHVI